MVGTGIGLSNVWQRPHSTQHARHRHATDTMRCSVAGHSPLRELRKHVGRLAVACTPLMQRDVLQASNPMVRSKVWIHAWIGWLGAVYMLHLALYMLHLPCCRQVQRVDRRRQLTALAGRSQPSLGAEMTGADYIKLQCNAAAGAPADGRTAARHRPLHTIMGTRRNAATKNPNDGTD